MFSSFYNFEHVRFFHLEYSSTFYQDIYKTIQCLKIQTDCPCSWKFCDFPDKIISYSSEHLYLLNLCCTNCFLLWSSTSCVSLLFALVVCESLKARTDAIYIVFFLWLRKQYIVIINKCFNVSAEWISISFSIT